MGIKKIVSSICNMKAIICLLYLVIAFGMQPCNAQSDDSKQIAKDLVLSDEANRLKEIGIGWLLMIAAASIIIGWIIKENFYDSPQNLLVKIPYSCIVIIVATSFVFGWPFYWAYIWPNVTLTCIFIGVVTLALWKTWSD